MPLGSRIQAIRSLFHAHKYNFTKLVKPEMVDQPRGADISSVPPYGGTAMASTMITSVDLINQNAAGNVYTNAAGGTAAHTHTYTTAIPYSQYLGQQGISYSGNAVSVPMTYTYTSATGTGAINPVQWGQAPVYTYHPAVDAFTYQAPSREEFTEDEISKAEEIIAELTYG